jgi:hypothetical protein
MPRLLNMSLLDLRRVVREVREPKKRQSASATGDPAQPPLPTADFKKGGEERGGKGERGGGKGT